MAMLRNGVSASGQLVVTDLAAFTLPKPVSPAGTYSLTSGSGTVTAASHDLSNEWAVGDRVKFGTDNTNYEVTAINAGSNQLTISPVASATQSSVAATFQNFTNVFARFGAMAIGIGTAAADAKQGGLTSEITTGGGGRRSGNPDVKTYLVDETSGQNAWTSKWETTWTFTAGFAVSELGVFNSGTANAGLCLLRQVFASPLDVVATDLLNLVVTVRHTGTLVAGSYPGTAGGVITFDGLKECAKLLMDSTTNVQGAWTTPDAGTKFDYIAVGSGTTACARTQTALVTEHTLDGLARAASTGSLKRDPPDFASDLQTNFKGDTVQWRVTYSVTGTRTVTEQGVFNASSGGEMLIRQLYANGLDLINTDTYIVVIRMVNAL